MGFFNQNVTSRLFMWFSHGCEILKSYITYKYFIKLYITRLFHSTVASNRIQCENESIHLQSFGPLFTFLLLLQKYQIMKLADCSDDFTDVFLLLMLMYSFISKCDIFSLFSDKQETNKNKVSTFYTCRLVSSTYCSIVCFYL